ncbi:MAG: multidrug efflux RND transporter permease subunit [Archangiaceae bacterium]|nr:multidrug efflux RND transporter permease subunit [Archangiaceae bacterium]
MGDGLSAPFIKRPIATSLLAAAVLLGGAAAYSQLTIAPLPNVDFPTINVNANLPGASPETMASAVATPLERRFGRIAGITEITSTSTLGSTSITLQFDLSRTAESAGRDVQAAINAASSELPTNLPLRPNFRKVNPSDAPILILSLTSASLPLSQVFDAANTVLAQKISQVDGVGQVFVGGGQQPAVRIAADPLALAGVGLSLEELRTTLAANTSNQPKGVISGATQASSISTNDQLFDAAAWRRVIVRVNGDELVRLSDVAQVTDDVENNRTAAWLDGRRAVLLIIRRQPGANILETIERIKALFPVLRTSVSPAIELDVALDRAQTIRASVRDVERTLVISVALVVLVVFVFLRSLRSTAIPAVAVPLSLVGTFGAMYLLDFSLNNLSLMALTIATGFVVDDAIVVTENITRYLEQGLRPVEAALKGAKQIGFTILSITVSLIAVFIPLLLMGGVVGRLFREFSITLAVSIAISAVVSLTLTPVMCATLLRRGDGGHGRLAQAVERGFERVVSGYGRALTWVLDHRRLMLVVTVALASAAVALFVTVPKGLFPQQDTGQLQGFTEGPQDVSFTSMRERQEKVLAVLSKEPNVKHAVAFIGGFGAGNTGNLFVALEDMPPRKQTADEIIGKLRPQLGKVEGIATFLQAGQDLRLGGRGSRTQYQYTLQDASLDELREWAPRVFERLKKVEQLRDVATDQQTAGLKLQFTVDRDTAARLGVTQQAIDDTLYDAFGQRQIATTFTQLNQYRVVLEVSPQYRASAAGLGSLYVRTNLGTLVPLASLGTSAPGVLPLSINHQGQFPATTLSFNLAPGVALGDAVDAIHAAEAEIGLPASVKAGFQGTAKAFSDSLASQPLLILMALLVVYIVLGVLYESYVHPITILSTLPSAGVGALVALMVFGIDLSIIAMVGLILLVGIVKKNAIMMIDFAIEAERDHGKSPRDAIYQACLLRFRPILMTTMAALLGALPLAFGTGMGSELRKPLGVAIVGGLLVSQLLTMFTTPVVYLALDRFSRRKRVSVPAEA